MTIPSNNTEKTILLIDDTQEILMLMRATLTRNNYQVIDTPYPEEAIEMCKQYAEPIDLLIVDMVMPQMYGQELTETLKAFHPEMKVLYVSGYSPETTHLEAHVPFLKKPFSPGDLLDKVNTLLAS